jgi:hypothetical protein
MKSGAVISSLFNFLLAILVLIVVHTVNKPLPIVEDVSSNLKINSVKIGPPSYSRILSPGLILLSFSYTLFLILKTNGKPNDNTYTDIGE